jgi:hypothetical protein
MVTVVDGLQNHTSVDILTAIITNSSTGNNSAIVYDHVNINGDLNLSNLDLSNKSIITNFNDTKTLKLSPFSKPLRIINCSIKIVDSQINGALDFSNTTFENSIDFTGTEFKKNATFLSARFSKHAIFERTTFSKFAVFYSSRFSDSAFFNKASFNEDANFVGSSFEGPVDFSQSNFRGIADFGSSTFCKPAYFTNSLFNNKTLFAIANFKEGAYFPSCNFNGAACFAYSTFKGNAIFLNTSFNLLDLRLTEYDKLYIDWHKISHFFCDNDSGDTSYQSLIENFKVLGFMDDADNCYYQMRIYKLIKENSDDELKSVFDFGAWIFYGFGKKPVLPLLWSIFFIILFGFLWKGNGLKYLENDLSILLWTTLSFLYFWQSYLKNYLDHLLPYPRPQLLILLMCLAALFIIIWRHAEPNKPGGYSENERKPISLPEAMSFSATVFLSGTKLFVDPPSLPFQQNGSGSFVKTMFVLERSLGALFSILFFLSISSTVARL